MQKKQFPWEAGGGGGVWIFSGTTQYPWQALKLIADCTVMYIDVHRPNVCISRVHCISLSLFQIREGSQVKNGGHLTRQNKW